MGGMMVQFYVHVCLLLSVGVEGEGGRGGRGRDCVLFGSLTLSFIHSSALVLLDGGAEGTVPGWSLALETSRGHSLSLSHSVCLSVCLVCHGAIRSDFALLLLSVHSYHGCPLTSISLSLGEWVRLHTQLFGAGAC